MASQHLILCYITATSIWNDRFRLINETFTEASLAPGIDQMYSTNSWPGEVQVYKVCSPLVLTKRCNLLNFAHGDPVF